MARFLQIANIEALQPSMETVMTLSSYFDETKGIGVLSTSNGDGIVNSAIYARPHVMEDGTLGLIMASQHSYENLKTNPHAAYLFLEATPGYRGKRFKLTKVKEERDMERIMTLRRRFYDPGMEEKMKPVTLVYFRVDEERPLVGAL
jgi:hypothetical protein